MTAFQSFPEEILRVIFSKLNHFDILQCQEVCQSWYFPAHIVLLRLINLDNETDLQRFVNSIDYNPNTYYLNAVQEITLGSPYTRVSSVNIDQLILRFPNLKSIVFYGDLYIDALRQFNDNVHQEALARSCPKLERFEIQPFIPLREYYFDLMYTLRQSLTWIALTDVSPLDNLENYLSDFPRLQTIWCVRGYLNNFEKCLPLIEKLPTLRNITIGHGFDEEGFAERYMSSKTKDERYLLEERLSSITSVTSYSNSNFCVDGAEFIMRYFKGLKSLALNSEFNSDWDDKENDVFSSLLNYACTLQKFHFRVGEWSTKGLVCLNTIIQMAQSVKTQKQKSTKLCLALLNDDYNITDENALGVEIDFSQDSHMINLDVMASFSADLSPQFILNTFDTVSSLDHIDTFALDLNEIRDSLENYGSNWNDVLKEMVHQMSSVKQVILDIPTVIGKELNLFSTSTTNLTLRAVDDVKNKELKKCILLFPTLRQLEMFYFSGKWQEDMYEFQISLGFCNLEKLIVDLTPVKRTIRNYSKDAFIVVEIKLFSNSERRLYKVPTQLLGKTEIADASLKGLTRGENYVVVLVTMNTLKCLDIFACRKTPENAARYATYYDKRGTDDLLYVNLFNDIDAQKLED